MDAKNLIQKPLLKALPETAPAYGVSGGNIKGEASPKSLRKIKQERQRQKAVQVMYTSLGLTFLMLALFTAGFMFMKTITPPKTERVVYCSLSVLHHCQTLLNAHEAPLEEVLEAAHMLIAMSDKDIGRRESVAYHKARYRYDMGFKRLHQAGLIERPRLMMFMMNEQERKLRIRAFDVLNIVGTVEI